MCHIGWDHTKITLPTIQTTSKVYILCFGLWLYMCRSLYSISYYYFLYFRPYKKYIDTVTFTWTHNQPLPIFFFLFPTALSHDASFSTRDRSIVRRLSPSPSLWMMVEDFMAAADPNGGVVSPRARRPLPLLFSMSAGSGSPATTDLAGSSSACPPPLPCERKRRILSGARRHLPFPLSASGSGGFGRELAGLSLPLLLER